MAERVAIVGVKEHKPAEAYRNLHFTSLIVDTVMPFLEEINMPWEEMESLVGAGCDMLDGRSISSVFTVDPMGGFMKEESKVEEDIALAVMYAFMRVASGSFKNALVCGYGKGSELHPHFFTGLQSEPVFMKPLGLDGLTTSAIQATAYMSKYGVSREAGAAMAAHDLHNALKNPNAQRAMDVTVDEVLKSKELAYPITELEYVPVSDGCVAVMLASEEVAGKYTDKPVWIEGIGNCNDLFYPGHRDLADSRGVKAAAERAYKMADIGASDIDLAEVYGYSSWQELMVLEGMGFAEDGAAPKALEAGKFGMEGELPVNMSGGALSANVWMACGGSRIAECFLQLRGEAGDRQVDGAKKAAAHATTGLALQSNTVMVLGR
ncbi:MAG: thiolase family protein [Actinomycetota bacterium]|nr:thiolase family protein [Actinomycetota bacterium]